MLYQFLVLYLFVFCSSTELYFRACTPDLDRLLLCINRCDLDADAWSDIEDDFFNIRQVVLDLNKSTLEKPRDVDKPVPCPSYDNQVYKQPHNSLTAECLPNNTIKWNFKTDQINISLETEIFPHSRFSTFFFVSNVSQRLYLLTRADGEIKFGQSFNYTEPTTTLENWMIINASKINTKYDLATITRQSKDTCRVNPTTQLKHYPAMFPTAQLVSFLDSPMWYHYGDVGLYFIADEGLIDSRRKQIIEVKHLTVTLHSYDATTLDYKKTIELADQLIQFKVSRPPFFHPSVVVFIICVIIVFILVAAEIITQRRKNLLAAEADQAEQQVNVLETDTADIVVSDDEEVEMQILSDGSAQTSHSQKRRGHKIDVV